MGTLEFPIVLKTFEGHKGDDDEEGEDRDKKEDGNERDKGDQPLDMPQTSPDKFLTSPDMLPTSPGMLLTTPVRYLFLGSTRYYTILWVLIR